MSLAYKTTTPTWHQPWACWGCHKHAEVIVKPAVGVEFLRMMARQISADHRAGSPLCMYDIDTNRNGFKPMVLGRPFRRGESGKVIYAEGPDETPEQALRSAMATPWPPWQE